VEATTQGGRPAVGISGEDAGLLQADFLDREKFGEVGTIRNVNPAPVHALLAAGFTPVVSPVSRGPEGAPLNVNADEAAIRVAAGLGANRLLLISDVPGVLVDGEVLRTIGEAETRDLAGRGILVGGMLVKVEQALEAARVGVEVRIGDEGLLFGAPGTLVGEPVGAEARS
jgi:acetylglutamate kinase